MKLQELRTMGKELGVDSPTTYPKRELVLKIMEKNGIVVDQNDLPAPPKRRGGRQKKDRSQDALGLEEPTYAEPLAQEDIAVQVEEPGVQPLREAQSAAVLPLFSEDIKPAVMLKRPAFWLYYVWAIAVSAAGLALISQASGVVWEASADQTAASVATIVGLISICNAVGRVLFGGMYDKFGRSLSMQLVNGLFILTSVVLLLAMSSRSVVVVIIGFVIGGLAYSGVTPTNSAFCRAYFGPTSYPVNFPLINSNLIFASFGSTISGALYDASGSYSSTFFLIIGLAVAGILCSLAISAIDRKRK